MFQVELSFVVNLHLLLLLLLLLLFAQTIYVSSSEIPVRRENPVPVPVFPPLMSHLLALIKLLKLFVLLHIKLTFQSLPVTLRTTRFNIQIICMLITLDLCILCGSQNKQQVLSYTCTPLTDWFL
jgi:hypothetical protein